MIEMKKQDEMEKEEGITLKRFPAASIGSTNLVNVTPNNC